MLSYYRKLRFSGAAEIEWSVKGSVWPTGAAYDLQCPLKSLIASVIRSRDHLMKCLGTSRMNWCWRVLLINRGGAS